MHLALGRTDSSAGPVRYVEIGIEILWLISVALVPLIFVPPGYLLSEATNSYVEIPKTVALRTLVGLMTALWIVEWLLKGGLHQQYSIKQLPSKVMNWLEAEPSRWIVVAAVFYITVAILATMLSVSFGRSLWGEVSGQFGYSAYTTLSYFLLFLIVVTHLKTYQQLWHLLIVLVASSTLIALFGIMQHYGFDRWDLGEGGQTRVSATMANPVFAGAFFVGSALLVFGLGLAVLNSWAKSHKQVLLWGALWVPLLAVQMLAVYWTGSRGSWLLGAPYGLLIFLHLPILGESIFSWKERRRVPLDMVAIMGALVVLDVMLLIGQLEFLDQVGRLGLSNALAARIIGFWLGILIMVSVVALMVPHRFAVGTISFARTATVLALGLLVVLLVVTLTPGPPSNPGLDLKDLSSWLNSAFILPIILMVSGAGLIGTFFVAKVRPMAHRLSRVAALAGVGLLILFLIFQLSPANPPTPTETPSSGEVLVEGQTPEATPAQTGRGISYRTHIWSAALRLSLYRPWFDYEPLPLSFIRPITGYGPEMFKYTFPLETPSGGLLSHAHNFFLHHWVEQGILGLFASLGLVLSALAVGLGQLWRNWRGHSDLHRWLLIAMLGTVVGRATEMMVGTARESDLVFFWVLLALLVILPQVLAPAPRAQAAGPQQGPPSGLSGRGTQGRTLRRRDRPARRRDGPGSRWGILQFLGAFLAALLIAFVGWLTWDRSLEYASASRSAALARDHFVLGVTSSPVQLSEVQVGYELMNDAVSKAPDIPNYRQNIASIFETYRKLATDNADSGSSFQSCAAFFSLEASYGFEGRPSEAEPFARCAEEAYLSNLRGHEENTNSPKAKQTLANSAMVLGLMGYEGKGAESIRLHEELTYMLPGSYTTHDDLGSAYLELGLHPQAIASFEASLLLFEGDKPATQTLTTHLIRAYNLHGAQLLRGGDAETALDAVSRSLDLAGESQAAGTPLVIQGVAFQQLARTGDAIRSLQDSLDLVDSGTSAIDAHRNLIQIYKLTGEDELVQQHQDLLNGLRQE